PQVDRCVLVCDMVITARGEIKAYQFYPAVMHSAARLTYTEVAADLTNTQVDRCVLVCDMVITARGEIKAYQFYPAVMHSAARLTYTEVAAVLTNTKGPEAAKRADLLPQLQNLYGVYKSLHAARQKRGAIDFDTTETYIVCNAQGKIEQIVPRHRNDAHRLIEESMLAANVCAADF